MPTASATSFESDKLRTDSAKDRNTTWGILSHRVNLCLKGHATNSVSKEFCDNTSITFKRIPTCQPYKLSAIGADHPDNACYLRSWCHRHTRWFCVQSVAAESKMAGSWLEQKRQWGICEATCFTGMCLGTVNLSANDNLRMRRASKLCQRMRVTNPLLRRLSR